MRPIQWLAVVCLLAARAVAADAPAMRVEHSKPLPRNQGLGTRSYPLTDAG